MIVLLNFILFSCHNDFVNLKTKGSLDDLIQDSSNYLSDDVMELDQLKVTRVMKQFLDQPEELEDPLALSVCDNISFIHLLFSVKSSMSSEDILFDLVYERLLKHKKIEEESIFYPKTLLGHNIIHLAIKCANQRGFEKIKELDKKKNLKNFFLSPDSVGKDSLILASHVLASGLIDSFDDDKPYYDDGSLLFLKDAILYMISKKYFLSEKCLLNENNKGRNFLTEAIYAFVEGYSDNFDFDDREGDGYVENFFSTFRSLFINFLTNLKGNSKALDPLMSWEDSIKLKVPALLKKKINALMEKVGFISKLNESSVLHKNEKGLLPIEEAIEVRNEEAVAFLINMEGYSYPEEVYRKIVDTGSMELFNLIPKEHLNYRIKGKTALMIALENGHEELCKLLLERGADVNVTAMDHWDKGKTVLILAAENGHEELCELLLERGADVNAVGNEGWTALMFAAKNGHKEVCELLLERGADVNAVGNEGWTALMLAAENGREEACDLLIRRGAKINLVDEDKDGKTALMLAAQNGHWEVCYLLIGRGAKIDLADKDGKTALMLAAQNGHRGVCGLLIGMEAKIDLSDRDGKTALMLAAHEGQKEVCDLLVIMGAKIDLSDKDGKTALMLAAQNGHREVCELLIGMEAKIDLSDKDGKTALMLAAENGHERVCYLLIGRGAKIDLADEDKDVKMALMLAAHEGQKEVCDLLIRRKARRSLTDKDGKTVKNTNKKTALSYQCTTAFLNPELPSHVSGVREIHSTGGLAEVSKEKDATVEKRE